MSKKNNVKIGDQFVIQNVTEIIWEVTSILDMPNLPPHVRMTDIKNPGTLVVGMAALADKGLFRQMVSPISAEMSDQNDRPPLHSDDSSRIETLFGNSSKIAASL